MHINNSTNSTRTIIYDNKDLLLMNKTEVVLTCYITSKVDPQIKSYQQNNNYDYMKPWYESMIKQDLHGIIFYDNLSEDFIEEYETDNIIFIKCQIGKFSINDERFFIYYDFLMNNDNYNKVIMTDISDVYFNKNPFELINNNHDYKIYVGTDLIGTFLKHPMYDEWTYKLKKIKLKLSHDRQIYNAGTLGGCVNNITTFLKHMIDVFMVVNSNDNNNMLILNHILFTKYNDKDIFTGEPWNTPFKSFINPNNTSCYIIHK